MEVLEREEFLKKINELEKPYKEIDFFDKILFQFIGSLNYNIGYGNVKGGVCPHYSEKYIEIYPDDISNVILLINYDKTKEIKETNEKTMIVNFNLKDHKMELLIEYFGDFVPLIVYNFDDESEENCQNYYNICNFISYDKRSLLDKYKKETFSYRLKLNYEMKNHIQNSRVLKEELNDLLFNSDDKLLELLSKNISEKTLISYDKILTFLNWILKNQNNDNHYQIIFGSCDKDDNKKSEDNKQLLSAKDIFENISVLNNNDLAFKSKKFKQR